MEWLEREGVEAGDMVLHSATTVSDPTRIIYSFIVALCFHFSPLVME